MSKRFRQYIGILAAVIIYYIIHEGAHLLVALHYGVFKGINFMGLGMQIDVYAERLTDTQLGLFCLAGPVETLLFGWVLTLLAFGFVNDLNKNVVCLFHIVLILSECSEFRTVRHEQGDGDRIGGIVAGTHSKLTVKRTCKSIHAAKAQIKRRINNTVILLFEPQSCPCQSEAADIVRWSHARVFLKDSVGIPWRK